MTIHTNICVKDLEQMDDEIMQLHFFFLFVKCVLFFCCCCSKNVLCLFVCVAVFFYMECFLLLFSELFFVCFNRNYSSSVVILLQIYIRIRFGVSSCIVLVLVVFFCILYILFIIIQYLVYHHQPSLFIELGVSAKPFTLRRSAVFRNAGNCSCDTFTSPAYMNSRMACRCIYETSFSMIIGCLEGFSQNDKKKSKYQLDIS